MPFATECDDDSCFAVHGRHVQKNQSILKDMSQQFDLFIGIDYSGAETAQSRIKALQVYGAQPGGVIEKQLPPVVPNNKTHWNWTRAEIAGRLIELANQGVRYLAGIDHGFSFPLSYFRRYKLKSWPDFLDDFCRYWPTDQPYVYCDFVRDRALEGAIQLPPGERIGKASEFRLCERWTSSARSVFHFDVQGSVAKSTHCGVPWLRRIRAEARGRVHIWPFDGWQPPENKAVIAEIYPSIFRNRYPRDDRSVDEQDAYAVARWLSEASARGILGRYFDPPLTLEERHVAASEGWILGIS